MECPHCRCHGTLNNHGRMRDNPARCGGCGSGAARGARAVRAAGAPFACGWRACWRATVWARASSRSSSRLGSAPPPPSAAKCSPQGKRSAQAFPPTAPTAWAKNFVRNQGGVRARLCLARAPPPPTGEGRSMRTSSRTWPSSLGRAAFTEAFQIRFQEPWPAGAGSKPGS